MAPNKFEKHIKKQMEEREIQPSSEAWNKLSKQLETTGRPEKKSYFWYGIAASFVGILMIAAFYFNSATPETNSSIQVVENPEKANGKSIEKRDENDGSNMQTGTIEVADVPKIEEEKVEEKMIKANLIPDSNKIEALAEQTEDPMDKVQIPPNNRSEEIINTKVLEVLAQVDVLEQANEALTDAEVDSLLRKAQEEILSDKLFRNDRSVDAMALLSEVENELDKSFRDQIFESLKNGFLKVRTAVADRNN